MRKDRKMEELADMSMAKFKMMNMENLKIFLFMRKKSVDGDLETLAAR